MTLRIRPDSFENAGHETSMALQNSTSTNRQTLKQN